LRVYCQIAVKSSSSLFWIAEYFWLPKSVSISFGAPLHANADQV